MASTRRSARRVAAASQPPLIMEADIKEEEAVHKNVKRVHDHDYCYTSNAKKTRWEEEEKGLKNGTGDDVKHVNHSQDEENSRHKRLGGHTSHSTTTTTTTMTTNSTATTTTTTTTTTTATTTTTTTASSSVKRLSYQEEMRLKREAGTRVSRVKLSNMLTTTDPLTKHWLTTSVQSRLHELFDYRPKEDPQSLDDIVSNLRKDLERHKRRIKALEKIIESSKEGEEYVHQLTDVPQPRLDRSLDLVLTTGYRLVDLKLMRCAMEQAQKCPCASKGGQLRLLELSPSHGQEDLATQLAFVCSLCHNATIFANSSFSSADSNLHNYTINRHFLDRLGTKAYFQLVQAVQEVGESAMHVKRHTLLPSQLVLSVEKNSVNSNKAETNAGIHEVFATNPRSSSPTSPLSTPLSKPVTTTIPTVTLKTTTVSELPRFSIPVDQLLMSTVPSSVKGMAPAPANSSFVTPAGKMPVPRLDVAKIPPPSLLSAPSSLSCLPHPTISLSGPASREPRKIPATPELPPGSRISILPASSPIIGRVVYTTSERTGLDPGSYSVARNGEPNKIIIVTRTQSTNPPVNPPVTQQIKTINVGKSNSLISPETNKLKILHPQSLTSTNGVLRMVIPNPNQRQPTQPKQHLQLRLRDPQQLELQQRQPHCLQVTRTRTVPESQLVLQDVRGNVKDAHNEDVNDSDDITEVPIENDVEPLPDISSFLHMELGAEDNCDSSNGDVTDALDQSVGDPLGQVEGYKDVVHLESDEKSDDDDPDDEDWGAKKRGKKKSKNGTNAKKKRFAQFGPVA